MIARHGLFFLSCLVAYTAGHMFNYTIILSLQESVGSDLLSGLGFGLAFGSSIVFGWFAGALCDRIAPGKVIHAAHGLFLLGLFCLWWADASAAIPARVAWTLAAALCGGLAWSFFGPARLTALAQVVSADELRPATILFNLQVLLGFGLAPVLIGFIRARSPTWAPVLGVSAAGFIAASALIASMVTYVGSQSNGQSLKQDIAEGFAALRDNPLLAQLMLAAAIGYSMTGPMQILLPKLARQNLALTETVRGLYLGLLAASLIVGGVLALALVRRVHNGLLIFGGIVVGSILFAALAVISSAVASALVLALVGVCGGLVMSLIVANLQINAQPRTRGRILAMYSMSSQVMPALSGIAAGALVRGNGLTEAILISGMGLAMIAMVGASLMSALRHHAGVSLADVRTA
jgi:MFS family permease